MLEVKQLNLYFRIKYSQRLPIVKYNLLYIISLTLSAAYVGLMRRKIKIITGA
jgi:hypothetical protein